MRRIRTFVAVEVPEGIQARVADAARTLAGPDDRVTWVSPPRIHVTVRFLGDVPENRVGSVTDAVREASRSLEPFRLGLEGMGVFPPGGPPRVLWVGVQPDAPLVALHRRVDDRLADAGFPPEGRGYHPHATCGRVRRARDPAALRRAVGERVGVSFGSFNVTTVSSFESVLGSSGPRYVRLASAPLGR